MRQFDNRGSGDGGGDVAVDISVIIPTFRRPDMLREAVRSALAQDGPAVEVVVVDDSPEGSARAVVATEGDPRVTYFKAEPPSGGRPAWVRNLGWPRSRGRHLHFLDDDDRVAPGAYRAALDAFSRTDAGLVFGRVEVFGDDGAAVRREQEGFDRAARCARRYGRIGSRRLLVAHEFFCPTLFVNSACLVRRDHLEAVGGYDPALPVIEDLDFIIRTIRSGGFAFIERTVLQYRITPGSLMSAHREGSAVVSEACRAMYARYKAERGPLEFLVLKLLGRGLLRWM